MSKPGSERGSAGKTILETDFATDATHVRAELPPLMPGAQLVAALPPEELHARLLLVQQHLLLLAAQQQQLAAIPIVGPSIFQQMLQQSSTPTLADALPQIFGVSGASSYTPVGSTLSPDVPSTGVLLSEQQVLRSHSNPTPTGEFRPTVFASSVPTDGTVSRPKPRRLSSDDCAAEVALKLPERPRSALETLADAATDIGDREEREHSGHSRRRKRGIVESADEEERAGTKRHRSELPSGGSNASAFSAVANPGGRFDGAFVSSSYSSPDMLRSPNIFYDHSVAADVSGASTALSAARLFTAATSQRARRKCGNRECNNSAGQDEKPRSIYCSKKCQSREQNIRQGRIKKFVTPAADVAVSDPAVIPVQEQQQQQQLPQIQGDLPLLGGGGVGLPNGQGIFLQQNGLSPNHLSPRSPGFQGESGE